MGSDDAIAVDFMASVQEHFARQTRLFVNFPRGIQIHYSFARSPELPERERQHVESDCSSRSGPPQIVDSSLPDR